VDAEVDSLIILNFKHMKMINIFRFFVMTLIVVGFTACSDSISDKKYDDLKSYIDDVRQEVELISQEDFLAILNQEGNYNLIDCREPELYATACITGATNVPRGMLEFSPKIQNRHLPTYIYSDNEDKSVLAAAALKMIKYSSVFVIQGSWKDWKSNYPDAIQLEPGGVEEAAAPIEEETGCGG
jgi:rhodanese-related sulfurtransferase